MKNIFKYSAIFLSLFIIFLWIFFIKNYFNAVNFSQEKYFEEFSEQEKIFPDEKKFFIWVQKIFWEEIKNYWVIWVIWWNFWDEKNLKINKIQEKPEFKNAISDLWIIWKYICNYEIFNAIQNWNKSQDWEIRLSNWFEEILKNSKNKVFWVKIKWKRYDTWLKNGFIKATIWFWIENQIIKKEEILDFLNKI